jgi:hypothetical protein
MYSTTQTTILFEEPFWIALIERKIDGQYSVARAIIGTSEPLGAHLVDFFGHLDYDKLHFSVPVDDICKLTKEVSFKKRLHKNKETQSKTSKHTYTKAQAMLKQQQSILKTERKQAIRLAKNEEKQLKYEMGQQKKKKKQKGH